MNREIKFRRVFKNKEGDIRMKYWGNIDCKDNHINDFSSFISPATINSYRPIIDEQFIIHEDGCDIYEGDIIEESKHGQIIRRFTAQDIRTFAREYDHAEHFCIWNVIGNVHENLELLNQ